MFGLSMVSTVFSSRYEVPLVRNGEEQNDAEKDDEHFCHPFMMDMLLERHKTSIPNHEPKLYCSAAAGTRSVPGFNILSFPDFWGHVPPPGHESMAQRQSSVQRYKDSIDWRWQVIKRTRQPISAVHQSRLHVRVSIAGLQIQCKCEGSKCSTIACTKISVLSLLGKRSLKIFSGL